MALHLRCRTCGNRFDGRDAQTTGSLWAGKQSLYCPHCGNLATVLWIDPETRQVVSRDIQHAMSETVRDQIRSGQVHVHIAARA